MSKALLLLAVLLASPVFAITMPEGGLPAGRIAVEPVVVGQRTTLATAGFYTDFMRGPGASLPGAAGAAGLDLGSARFAAGALQSVVPPSLWTDVLRSGSMDAAAQASLVESLKPYLAQAGKASARQNKDLLIRLQHEIDAGRIGQADLEDVAAALKGLSVHGAGLAPALTEVSSALETQKSAKLSGIVTDGTKTWTQGKSSEELGASTVGRESSVSSGLSAAGVPEAKTRTELPAPKAAAPSAPAPSKLKAAMKWALPILAGIVLIVGLDWGTKYLATKFLFTAFHEASWRKPLMEAIVPFITFTAYKARAPLGIDHTMWKWSIKQIANGKLGFYKIAVSGMETMLSRHPSLKWATRLYDVSIAMMLGGMLGNGIDLFRLGGALDWIPLGRSLMNFADVALLLGLSFFQLATHFFVKAARADHEGKILNFNTANFLALPIVGFFVAWAFGSAKDGEALALSMKSIGFLYLMGFSMLIGISRVFASTIIGRFAAKFVAEQDPKKA